MHTDRLVLGIDGGATKTVAWLARADAPGQPAVAGRGTAGPSNPQAVGFDEALSNLDRAVDAAFQDAGLAPGAVDAAVLGLAGSDRPQNRQRLARWAEDRRLARRFRAVHDAVPVLAAGSSRGWGVALIAGTGSFAFGRDADGRTARAGGWGFLFGDEGSGYAVALAGLRAAAQSADGRAGPTRLLDALLERLDLGEPQELIPAVYAMAGDRARIASLADVLTEAADGGDRRARQILDEAAGDLAAMVGAVAARLGFAAGGYALAVSGGLLLGSKTLRSLLEARLDARRAAPAAVALVRDPVAGAVRLARDLLGERGP